MSMKEITPPVAAPQPCAPADFMREHETDVIYLVNALGLLVQPDLIPDRPINDFDRLKSEWNRAAKANEEILIRPRCGSGSRISTPT